MADINTGFGYQNLKRLSWGAIFAGTALALVAYFLLNLLGAGIGLGVLNFGQSADQAQGIGIGAAIWLFLATVIALFVGGWAAGRFSGTPSRAYGLTHGLITFSLFTIATLFVLTSGIGSILSGAGGMLGQVVSAMGPQAVQALGAGEAAENVDPQAVAQTAESVREAVAQGAIYAFIALALGGVAAALGGLFGTPKMNVSGTPGAQPT